MKFISVVFFMTIFFAIKARELTKKERNQIALDCIKQTQIQQEIVEQAIAGNIPENNSKYKDFLACSYKKQGYQSETGVMLMENVKTFLAKYYNPSDLAPLNDCGKFNETNHGENAFKGLKCIINHTKTLTPVT